MKDRFIKVICGIILSSLAFTACSKMPDSEQENPEDNSTIKVEDIVFTAKSGTFAGTKLPYREGHINTDNSTVETILVLYLHGGSSKGDDNEKQMKEDGIASICSYLKKQGVKATFIIPQCPSNTSWGGKMNTPLVKLINSYVCNAVYGFGGSMGGTGLGSLVSAYPEKFTAAMLVAWNPTMTKAENLAKVPFYTVMGLSDNIMDAGLVKSFVENVEKYGGIARYEQIEGWDHGTTCTKSYTDDRLAWVFGNKNR